LHQNGVFVQLCTNVHSNFLQNLQNIVGTLLAWAPCALMWHLWDHIRSIGPLLGRWIGSWAIWIFLVQDVHFLHLEVPFILHLDHSPTNHMVRINNILISKRRMKQIMNFHGCKQCNHVHANRPILFKTSNGLQYLTTNFGKLPNFNELLFAFILKNTFFPTLNQWILYVLHPCVHIF